jgi:5-guanidino-2-oxopentanoate decarboxylase
MMDWEKTVSSNTTCGQAVTSLLEAYGVDTVFGIPGVHTLELYRGLGDTEIRHIQPRHEQGAGFMADGYARASGRPGVCYLITGPGVTNAATPIGQAFSDSMPMLVISSTNASPDLGMRRGRLHEITDQDAVTKPITAFSKTAPSHAEVPNLIAEAFAVFRNGRPRPVHISLPLDVIDAPADYGNRVRNPAPPPTPPIEAIEAAAEALRGAKRPVFIVGGGTVDCAPAVRALAEAVGAVVMTTIAAKGVVPDGHPLSIGATMSLEPTLNLLGTADVVLVAGSELSETDTWAEELQFNGTLIRIDIEASTTQRDYAADVALVGDAGRTLSALLRQLDGHSASAGIGGGELAELREKNAARNPLQRKHVKVLDALRAALPANGIVASDVTQIAYTGNFHFPCSEPRQWFHPSGYCTLGWAMPAAIGAKLALPDTAVAAIAGDGGFLFTAPELGTAVEQKLPIPIILWNNDGLGEIRDGMIAKDIPEIGVNPVNPDYLMLAKSFGCYATRPDSLEALQAAISDAFTADAPTLIEVRQDSPFLEDA